MTEHCQIRMVEKKTDYPIIAKWWEAHGWTSVPSQMLPPLGVVAFNSAHDCAAGWLYMDNGNSGVSMLEWLVSNPKISARESMRGIKAVTDFLGQAASEMGYSVMITTCRQESLARLHERNGFARTDEGMIHLVKVLQKES